MIEMCPECGHKKEDHVVAGYKKKITCGVTVDECSAGCHSFFVYCNCLYYDAINEEEADCALENIEALHCGTLREGNNAV